MCDNKNCKSDRVVVVAGKCSDIFNMTLSCGKEYSGYVPDRIGIGSDDYIEFDYCFDCGKIQGKFPITKKAEKDICNEAK